MAQVFYKLINNFMKQFVGEWKNIPEQAFFYFPEGEEIIVGDGEKQWRKMFEGGYQFTQFQKKCLNQLEVKLRSKNIQLDPWFDQANRLRFIQANKFDISKSIDSMSQTTKWRASSFPVTESPKVLHHLTSGAFYFCGRDNKFRPILMVNIEKFNTDDDEDESIPHALVIVMEFMINELLIEGQVENYVLIMNLQAASLSYRKVIMKILSFTSNAYRGRLFASYLLSMPSIIRWSWDAIISKFVSQNTLKKIKISGNMSNDEMWTHISKKTIERTYGGERDVIKSDFWPPNREFLLFVDTGITQNLITVDQYKHLHQSGKLNNRKILQKYVGEEVKKVSNTNNLTIQNVSEMKNKGQNKSGNLLKQFQDDNMQIIPIRNLESIRWPNAAKQIEIKMQTHFPKDNRHISTCFQSESFKKISKVLVVM